MATGITIEPQAVATDRFALWGVTVNDYNLNGVRSDFESVIVEVTTRRASTIEAEIQPLSSLVQKRNRYLKTLGDSLSELSKIQENFKSDDAGDTRSGTAITNTDLIKDLLAKAGKKTDSFKANPSKAETAQYIQLIKTEMEKLNNDSQTDTTRLQSLVSKRDDSFTTASSIMSAVSETRGNVIKAMP